MFDFSVLYGFVQRLCPLHLIRPIQLAYVIASIYSFAVVCLD